MMILAIDEVDNCVLHIMMNRFKENLHQYNLSHKRVFKLGVSMGPVCKACICDTSLDELIGEADKAMYQQKTTERK